MSSIINFDYKGSQISFMSGENVMVNATQMAKPFDKSPKDFLKTDQTKRFISALSEVKKILSSDLVRVVYGDNGGTWMHEDIALEFARWLSPAFAIWCNDRIKELLKIGVTTVSNDDEVIAHAMQVLNRRLEESRAEKELLSERNKLQQAELQKAAPKIEYYNEALSSDGTYTTTQIAKDLGMHSVKLNKLLNALGVQYKQGKIWLLYAKYQDNGYTKLIPHYYTTENNEQKNNPTMKWTEKGRQFILGLRKEGRL